MTDINQLIAELVNVDEANGNHLSIEKKRELSIQIRSLRVEREANKTAIEQWTQSCCAKIEWHFQQVLNFVAPFENMTLNELEEQGLLEGFKLLIPTSLVTKSTDVAKSAPISSKRLRPHKKSLRKLHSTLTSSNVSVGTDGVLGGAGSLATMPHFGNISLIKPVTVTYKGSRRSSTKAAVLLSAKHCRSGVRQSYCKDLVTVDENRPSGGGGDSVGGFPLVSEELAEEADDEEEGGEEEEREEGIAVNVAQETIVRQTGAVVSSVKTAIKSKKNRIHWDAQIDEEKLHEKVLEELRKTSDYSSIQEFLEVFEQKLNRHFDQILANLDPVVAETRLCDIKNVEFIVWVDWFGLIFNLFHLILFCLYNVH